MAPAHRTISRNVHHRLPMVNSCQGIALFLCLLTCVTASYVIHDNEAIGYMNPFHNIGDSQMHQEPASPRPCPCADVSLCDRIKASPKRQVFVFSVGNPGPSHWLHYDWTKVTTVALVKYLDDKLMCHAHSKGARVVLMADFAKSNLTNAAARRQWVVEQINCIKYNFLDGINVDFEHQIDPKESDVRQGLLDLMIELYAAAKNLGSEVQVTMDFASFPACPGRCYDYQHMADILDFVFIMDYDESGGCHPGANCDYAKTKRGLEKFIKQLNIAPSKLILGVPWYGYYYKCFSYNMTTNKCTATNGTTCTGSQASYSSIVNYLAKSFTGLMWDDASKSPYFSVKDSSSQQITQVWYDNPESLRIKYQLAGRMGLRGVGMWYADTLDYTNHSQVADMWGAIP